jgi:hypothetical protein
VFTIGTIDQSPTVRKADCAAALIEKMPKTNADETSHDSDFMAKPPFASGYFALDDLSRLICISSLNPHFRANLARSFTTLWRGG